MEKFINLINNVKKTYLVNPLHLATNMNLHHLCKSGNVSNKVATQDFAWVNV
jgi:hypothetical protein